MATTASGRNIVARGAVPLMAQQGSSERNGSILEGQQCDSR